MSPVTIGSIFLLSLALSGVSTWTIDLPEARKYFFEKADESKHKDEVIKDYNEGTMVYDNIVPDSPHNRDELSRESAEDNDVYGGKYAEDYEYMSYMEKKVHGIVHNGSMYLEGLRRALEDYGELLQNCSRLNFTRPQSSNGPWLPENVPGQPSFLDNQSGPFNNQRGSNGNQPGSFSNQAGSFSNQPGFFNNQPGSNGNQPGSFRNQPGSNGNQPGSFNNQPGSNGNQPGSFSNQPSSNSNQPGTFSNQNGSSNNQGPFNGSLPLSQTTVSYESCARASRSSEHVRRLAELALWATRELQDRAYADKYDKKSHDEEEEEAELLVRLAFFLDRLAFFTGFEPQHRDYVTEKPTRASTTTSAPFSVMGDIPDDVKMLMMNCLHSNFSEVTATDRCRYPLDHPDFIKRMFNITDSPNTVRPMSTDSSKPSLPLYMETMRNPPQIPTTRKKREILSPKQGQEYGNKEPSRDKRGFLMNALFGQRLAHKILEGVQEEIESEHFEEIHHRRRLFEKLTMLKNSYKKLVEFIAAIRHRHQLEKALEEREGEAEAFKEKRMTKERQKRQAEKPIVEFMKYYAKHEVWANSNQENRGEFDVANKLSNVKVVTDENETTTKTDIVRIHKRSIDSKKYDHLKTPENPAQDLSKYVKHKKGVNYITDENQIQKLRQYLDKIQHSQSSTAKQYAQKILKRQRRSNKYGRKFLPSDSQNPSQDISYYSKNKEGTEYQMNAVQAAQVRGSLERIFQYPDIQTVRRYGANVNPLIPYPLGYGLFLSYYADL